MIWFERTCTCLIWFDPVLSNLIQSGPICSNQSHLIHFDLTWTNLNLLDLIWTKYSIWFILIYFDKIWTSLSQFEPNWSKFIWFEPIWTKLDQASLHKLKKTLASDYLVPHCIVFYSQRVIVKDQEGTFFENDDKNRGVFFLSVLTDGIREVAWRLQSTRKQCVFHFLGFTVVCILVRISLFQDSEENIHSTVIYATSCESYGVFIEKKQK